MIGNAERTSIFQFIEPKAIVGKAMKVSESCSYFLSIYLKAELSESTKLKSMKVITMRTPRTNMHIKSIVAGMNLYMIDTTVMLTVKLINWR